MPRHVLLSLFVRLLRTSSSDWPSLISDLSYVIKQTVIVARSGGAARTRGAVVHRLRQRGKFFGAGAGNWRC